MQPFVEISFHHLAHDHALEGAVHRWVARFFGMQFDLRRSRVRLEPVGRNRTGVWLELALAGGQSAITVTAHEDPFVAISDAFRAARRQLLPIVASRISPAER